ncbi:MAG: sulfotransferase family 2 domain-containing protein [Longimicrobiales bacterium]
MRADFSPLCYFSEERQYIWIHVAKNASSTLRSIFGNDLYQARSCCYVDLPPHIRRGYTTIVFLRNPIERTLSAYQEVSLRADTDEGYLTGRKFLGMPEGLDRFAVFLDEVSQDPWDGHVLSQSRFIQGIRVDLWGTVETIEADLARVCTRVNISRPEVIPKFRSRAERVASGQYFAHDLDRQDLTPHLAKRILDIYREDYRLYQEVIRDRNYDCDEKQSASG